VRALRPLPALREHLSAMSGIGDVFSIVLERQRCKRIARAPAEQFDELAVNRVHRGANIGKIAALTGCFHEFLSLISNKHRLLRWELAILHVLILARGVMTAHAQTPATQSYPTKAIRIIVPWPAGGTTDILGRIVGQKLNEQFGQPVVIDNRGGASGNIGTEAAVRSAADGYTLAFGSMSTHTMNQFLYRRMSYDPVNDVATISLIANVASVLVTHPSLPAKNVKELIVLAKARPGQLNYASGSSVYQLCGELLKMTAKIELVHVPYKGGSQALTDLLGGQIELLFTGAPVTMPHIVAGKLRALAVTNAKRAAVLPAVPTIGETLQGYEFNNWYGIMAPAGTPRPVIDRLNTEVVRILGSAEIREKFLALGADPMPSTPEQFSAVIKADSEKSRRIIQAAGVRAE
jgi:tripartite-type tricarboxylate transporter receptor subunit TctC